MREAAAAVAVADAAVLDWQKRVSPTEGNEASACDLEALRMKDRNAREVELSAIAAV